MALRRALAGLLAAPTLVLSGCGGDSSVADPPVQSSPTSSATSDPPAHETAEHFIRRWAEAEKQMENTGKTADYLALSRQCRSCRELADDVTRFYAAGGYVKWGGWRIVSIKGYPDSGRHDVFAMRARSAATSYKESSSSAERRLSGGLATDLVTLARTPGGWRVIAFTKLGG